MLKLTTLFCTLLMCTVGCKPVATGEESHQDKTEEKNKSHGFDVLASDYYEAQSRVIWQKPDLVLNLLGNLRGKTVADIGAGTGFFSFRIANQGAKVIAIDIDPRAIAWIDSEKSRYPIEVQTLLETRLATPDNPNLRPNEADLVLMVNTYIYIEERVQYFSNLRTGLKPQAEIIIIDFKNTDTPIGPDPEERMSMQQVQNELVQAGFTLTLSDSTSLQYQYMIKAAL